MKAYSTDLREKIALAYEHNDYTLDDVAHLFDVGRRTVARFVQMRRTGLSLAPRPHAGGYPTALTAQMLSILRDKVVETPDATLSELVSYLKTTARVQVHLSTLCRALQRLGCREKKTLAASERDEEERLAFRRRMASVDRRKLVFTDETGFHLAFTRAFGRAPRGERASRACAV